MEGKERREDGLLQLRKAWPGERFEGDGPAHEGLKDVATEERACLEELVVLLLAARIDCNVPYVRMW